jgi:hypothetical protein
MDEPKAAKFDWDSDRGVLIVSSEDGKTSLAFPIAALPALGFRARRFMAGLAAQGERQKAKEGGNDWIGLSAPTAETARVQTMQTLKGERVVLIFDPETDREYPTSFATREFALEVGQELVAVATVQPTTQQAKN